MNSKFLQYGGLAFLVLLTILAAQRWGLTVAMGIPVVSALLWFGLIVLFCLLGDLAASQGNYPGALRHYSQAEKLHCRRAQLYCNRGKIFYRTGEQEKAALDFGRSLELNPKQAEAYLGRGAILMATGQNTAALNDYDRAIEYQPDLAEANHSRGIIQLRLGNLTAAQADFQQSIALKPDFFHPHYYLGLVQTELGALEQAQQTISQAIELRPQYPPLYYLQGKLIRLQEQQQATGDQLEQLTSSITTAQQSFASGQDWETQAKVDQYVNDEYGYFYRGWAMQEQSDLAAAHQAWQQAHRLATRHHNQPLLIQINQLLAQSLPEALN